jgi:aminoglycoside phosphotransferase (APT) family kinase protein
VNERDVDPRVVSCLLHQQFPHYADLFLRPVELGGWDNTTFRLGDHLLVRLPNEDAFVEQIEKEQRWLPIIAEHVPFPIPSPVCHGAPGCGFRRSWSIYGWLEGLPVGLDAEDLDFHILANDLARFLTVLHRVPTVNGPIPGAHNYQRGGPLLFFDDQVRGAIRSLSGRIDTNLVLATWDAAVVADWHGCDVWIHGDMTGSNILTSGGRLSGVIDFGCSAVGDPACDLGLAWTLFEGASRNEFIRSMNFDDKAWARARGWTLWKALKGLAALPEDHPRNSGQRLGWRWRSTEVVDRLIDAHCR